VVALGKLGPGKVYPHPVTEGAKTCQFNIYMSAPKGLGIYGIEVSHRGRLQYSEADLAEAVELKLR
jgi:hypothetical protein